MTCPQQPYQPLLGEPGVEGYCGGVDLGSMIGGKLGGWNASATAVRSHLVVVAAPLGDNVAGLSQRREPVLVQAFVAELAVE